MSNVAPPPGGLRLRRALRADIHFHLLPGVDDGPGTIEESVELAGLAVQEGTSLVVATPHVRHDFLTDVRDLPDRVRAVADAVGREGIELAILPGAEVGHEMVARLSQAELETVAIGPPGARWILVETPFAGIGDDFHAATDELRDRGFAVVLGHPERSPGALGERGGALRRERDRGARMQVNALSLTGRHGEQAATAATSLLSLGLADVIASDAHSRTRPPALTAGLEAALARGVPRSAATRSTGVSPGGLVERGLAVGRDRVPVG